MRINIERVILVALLIVTSINLVVTITSAKAGETKPIEQRKGYWVEETPDFQEMQLEIIAQQED